MRKLLTLAPLALLLSAQTVPASPAQSAAEIRNLLDRARATIAALGLCLAESRYEALVQREAEARHEAIGLFGNAVLSDEPEMDVGTTCEQSQAPVLEQRAAAELDAATAAFARVTAAMPGLWLGTIRLCGPAVVNVADAFGDYGDRVVTMRLGPAAAQQLAAETADRIAQPLALRLDGRLLAAPYVNEQISSGNIQFTGEGFDAASLRAAARRPC